MITTVELRHVLDPQTLIDLADDSQSGMEDTDIIETAANLADLEIRNRMGFTDSGDELPDRFRDIWITLTVERLFERRRDSVPTLWKERSTRARELLGQLGSGSDSIPFSKNEGSGKPCSTRSPEERSHQPENLRRY